MICIIQMGAKITLPHLCFSDGGGQGGGYGDWLGLEESNLRIQIQSLLSYH